MGIPEFLVNVAVGLVANAISSTEQFKKLSFFDKEKINAHVKKTVIGTVEPMIPFLDDEKISNEDQKILIDVSSKELEPFAKDSKKLFENSLDGQKLFDYLYKDELPARIVERKLEVIYARIFPLIATVLCTVPPAVKDWDANVAKSTFDKLDDIEDRVSSLISDLNAQSKAKADLKDDLFRDILNDKNQRLKMDIDLSGLRADFVYTGAIEDFFVHPEIEYYDSEKREVLIREPEDSLGNLVKEGVCSIVYGDPGAGKSTWTKWLEGQIFSSDWNGLPIRFEFRANSTKAELPSVHDLVRSKLSTHFREDATSGKIRDWLSKKDVLFILDGFDEIPPSRREEFCDWIVGLRCGSAECPIVITSRELTTNHLERLGQGWTTWHIKPFDEDRIQKYIKLWHDKMPLLSDVIKKDNSDQLAKELSSDPVVKPLTSNPLLLSTLLMIHHLDGRLPDGRAQLYARYVDGMLGGWDSRRDVKGDDLEISLHEKKQILTKIALHFHLNEIEQVDEDKVLTVINDCLHDMNLNKCPESILSSLCERSGLIVGPGIYNFAHKSVSEYLVAAAAVQGNMYDHDQKRIDRLRLYESRDDDRWNVVIFLWAGLAPVADVEAFVSLCMDEKCFSLGLGVLLDQLSRFDNKTKQNLILKVLKQDLNLKSDSERFVYDGPGSLRDEIGQLYIPELGIRSVSGKGRAFSVFDENNVTKLFGLDEYRDITDQNLRKLVWISLIMQDCPIEDWNKCLDVMPVFVKESLVWMVWLAGMSLRLSVRNKLRYNDSYAHAFEECSPLCNGFLLVALLSYFNRDVLSEFPIVFAKYYPLYLEYLCEIKDTSIHSSLLSETVSWHNEVGSTGNFDLLVECKKFLEENSGVRLEVALASRGIEIVNTLIEERSTLMEG
ncbi:NACHT domain-containing NTPase [Desulfovibrio sp. UCD-KL4C]|uniref:NACHT domain-containing protein n=1 Tax=Desulfovibrio sp. UCD-KL4C TaxID=2578120 RepID=UPI0025BFD83E|nr:NACHT domain-containing protein [Desulfovibrio sp. UCD-KL4C]